MLSDKLHVCDNTFKSIFQICSFTHRLKSLREADSLTDSGKVFHSRDAEEEVEPSYIAFFDLGTAREPLVEDLSVRLCDCDIGVRRSDIYAGVRLFSAL